MAPPEENTARMALDSWGHNLDRTMSVVRPLLTLTVAVYVKGMKPTAGGGLTRTGKAGGAGGTAAGIT